MRHDCFHLLYIFPVYHAAEEGLEKDFQVQPDAPVVDVPKIQFNALFDAGDDVNIKDYNLYELRKRIGFISQEPSMFKTSNIENIRYGDLNASDGECFEAAEKVHASYLLQNDKVNDLTTENKDMKKAILSGGEKQKLAMGRIILKNPQILLLDEATSALDKDSEREIQRTLDEISNDKTTISIAHRLSTIENYDQIYVLDNGRIHEHGTHEELMKLQKRYYTLHKFSSLS